MLFTDLANPKGNLKTSGFTVEERESFSTLLEENKLIDSFRHLYPEKKDAYSYWSYRSNARKNNKGWYIHYTYVYYYYYYYKYMYYRIWNNTIICVTVVDL